MHEAQNILTDLLTCLQVEHGITEMVTGVDLVNWQLQLQVPGLAPPDLAKSVYEPSGSAMEARICAEEPFKDFAPSSGVLGQVAWPPSERSRSHFTLCCQCVYNAQVSAYSNSLRGMRRL